MTTQSQDRNVQVRVLNAQDAAAYQPLRLRALKEHPEAFASSYEDEARVPLGQVEERLSRTENTTFGAFVDGALAGVVTLARTPRPKLRHRASIVAMYVAPEARGRGVGKRLIQAAIDEALRYEHILDVTLSLTVGNESARALYVSMGFEPFALEPRFIYLDGRFYDGEWMIRTIRDHTLTDRSETVAQRGNRV